MKRIMDLLRIELPGQCYLVIIDIILGIRKFDKIKFEDLQLEAKIMVDMKEIADSFEEIFGGNKTCNS